MSRNTLIGFLLGAALGISIMVTAISGLLTERSAEERYIEKLQNYGVFANGEPGAINWDDPKANAKRAQAIELGRFSCDPPGSGVIEMPNDKVDETFSWFWTGEYEYYHVWDRIRFATRGTLC